MGLGYYGLVGAPSEDSTGLCRGFRIQHWGFRVSGVLRFRA